MGFFLVLIALEITFVAFPFAIAWGMLRSSARPLRETNRRMTNIALAIDILVKHLFASALDDLFVKDKSLSFSRTLSSTISEDLGAFEQLLGLSERGIWLVQRLHYLDPWHVEKAIGLQVPEVRLSFWQQASRFAAMLCLFAVFACVIAAVTVLVFI